jgi:hypothetical protein
MTLNHSQQTLESASLDLFKLGFGRCDLYGRFVRKLSTLIFILNWPTPSRCFC